MKYKTLDDFNFKGKKVLLRCDLNSPVKNGRVVDNDRIKESAKTIKELKRKGARVVIIAHQSRPGKKDFLSLKGHAKLLNKYVKVGFVHGFNTSKAMKAIGKLKNGGALLLENVRNLKEEFNPNVNGKMVRAFRDFDIYINDAFSVSHRKQTSVVSFPKVMDSGIGRLMELELGHLSKVRSGESLFILAGAKPEENMVLLKKNKRVLACGLFGQLCLIAKGYDLGKQRKVLKDDLKLIPKLRRIVKSLKTPLDLAVRIGGKRKEIELEDFPSKHEIFDIGPRTVKHYVSEIRKAKTIFMKGTAGYCEEAQFCYGTRELLKAIASSKGFSVLGGGHLSAALKKMKINKKKFGYVSLAGGALERYVAGEKLPGLEVLERKK